MSLSKCTAQYKSNHQRCSSTEHQIQVGANNCIQNTASPNTKATVQPSMHQFNGASTRYQSNFGEVHLYKGLHLCDTSQLTKAIGATKPTQRFAQSTFASSQLCSSEKNPPKDFTKHTCNMPVHIVNLYNDVFQSKPDPTHFVHCAHNKPKTTDQLRKASNSFQVPYLLWAS